KSCRRLSGSALWCELESSFSEPPAGRKTEMNDHVCRVVGCTLSILIVNCTATADEPARVVERPQPQQSQENAPARPAEGPLKIHPTNRRYFTDGNGVAVYLTGSHTWGNLCDYPPDKYPPFDYPAYLDFLDRFHHNFIRLWPGGLDSIPSL